MGMGLDGEGNIAGKWKEAQFIKGKVNRGVLGGLRADPPVRSRGLHAPLDVDQTNKYEFLTTYLIVK